jgi:uncharacterized protein (TIGR02722 family)
MNKILPLLALAALTGCQTTPAVYVDANKGGGIVSLDKIDVQDFANAADSMLQSLYDSPAFAGASRGGQRPVFMLGNITNDTASNFDTSLLTKRITISLTRSGKVGVAKAAGFGGAQDQAAAEARRNAAFLGGEQAKPILPDYTLSGKIIEARAQAGNVRQTSYVFQLSLTEVKTGLATWEEEKTITKQGTKNQVGF